VGWQNFSQAFFYTSLLHAVIRVPILQKRIAGGESLVGELTQTPWLSCFIGISAMGSTFGDIGRG